MSVSHFDSTRPRTAMITAASSGIGLAIARAFACRKYRLVLTSRKPEFGSLLSDKVFSDRTVEPVTLDLCREDSIVQAFRTAVDKVGFIDILVNNAGSMSRKSILDLTWSEWDEVIDVNLKGAFFLSARFAEHCMENDRPGVIVNISSTHGVVPMANRSVYSISKAGLIHATRSMSIEWAEHGIRVNALAPTTVLTPSRQEAFQDATIRKRMLDRIPTGRFVTEEEVAAAVCYLASDEAASITGHTLSLDGGLGA